MHQTTGPARNLRHIEHDMRNALHSISAGMGIISKTNADPRLDRIFSLMAEGVDRMQALVSELRRPPEHDTSHGES